MSKSTKENTPQQVEIAFTIEGNTASREAARKIAVNVTHLHKVDISIIRIRPDNFNARVKPPTMTEEMWEKVLMIPTLAEQILANSGPADPIRGDFHTDGHFYITNGERRYRAVKHLLSIGKQFYPNDEPISTVIVLQNKPGTTDLERKKMMYVTNDNLPFTQMQKCRFFLSLSEPPYNLTQEQIGEDFRLSRATVGNYIMATTLPTDVQDKIDSGEVKMSHALAELRASNKPTKDDGQDIPTAGKETKEAEAAAAKEKIRGDEDEFDQRDNSVTGTGSMGGPKTEGSGAHVIGKDSIYMNEQKRALWKQALNRLDVIRNDVASNLPMRSLNGDALTPEEIGIWVANEVAIRMMNEYNLTVK